MKIQHQQNTEQGTFFILDDSGNKIAHLDYIFESPKRINAHHTYVSETLRGQGVADKLYQALTQFVREKQLNLHPTCSYIAKKWERENR